MIQSARRPRERERNTCSMIDEIITEHRKFVTVKAREAQWMYQESSKLERLTARADCNRCLCREEVSPELKGSLDDVKITQEKRHRRFASFQI